jgi:hypothetical protein
MTGARDLLKADPSKSDRQIAKEVGASHPHVARVRNKLEKSGEVETVSTRNDSKGRAQPARKGAKPAKVKTVSVKIEPAPKVEPVTVKVKEAAAIEEPQLRNVEQSADDPAFDEWQVEFRRQEREDARVVLEIQQEWARSSVKQLFEVASYDQQVAFIEALEPTATKPEKKPH